MWQEIVAIDTKLNDYRMKSSKELRPLYLKRRLQLLQQCNEDPDQYVMRNKKYISLRVKLLKKQFGLPPDLQSLKSLSLSTCEKESNFSYNGVHYVIQLKNNLSQGTRLLFR